MPEGLDLKQVLDVYQSGEDEFTSRYLAPSPLPLFGGQVAAQALSAAFPTVAESYVIGSAHVSFLSGGDAMAPVTFTVQRERDSRAFAHRQVLATQGERLIAHVGFTFHIPEGGQDVQLPSMPVVDEPPAWAAVDSPASVFEFRVPDSAREYFYAPRFWAKPTRPLGDDPRLNACALLYLSDAHSGIPMLHKLTAEDFHASLDHAIWFHRPANMNDWVLVDKLGESLADGRGWYRGSFFGHDGQLLASMAQEMLLRPAATTEKVVQ